MVRIASFNVENLFERPKALSRYPYGATSPRQRIRRFAAVHWGGRRGQVRSGALRAMRS